MRSDQLVMSLRRLATLQAAASTDAALQQLLEVSKKAHGQATGDDQADLAVVVEVFRAEVGRRAST